MEVIEHTWICPRGIHPAAHQTPLEQRAGGGLSWTVSKNYEHLAIGIASNFAQNKQQIIAMNPWSGILVFFFFIEELATVDIGMCITLLP